MKNFWLDRRKERQSKRNRNINLADFNKKLLAKMIQARKKP